MTALMLAAQRGHASIATILLRSGSDVDKQTRQGSTALLLASKRGHTAAVESLLTAGADIFLKDDRDKTAAETAHRRGHVDLFLKITVAVRWLFVCGLTNCLDSSLSLTVCFFYN